MISNYVVSIKLIKQAKLNKLNLIDLKIVAFDKMTRIYRLCKNKIMLKMA